MPLVLAAKQQAEAVIHPELCYFWSSAHCKGSGGVGGRRKSHVRNSTSRRLTDAPAWNKGRIIGQKRPLQLKQVWAIRVRLEIADNIRDLAVFNMAIDCKLRGCDLVLIDNHHAFDPGQDPVVAVEYVAFGAVGVVLSVAPFALWAICTGRSGYRIQNWDGTGIDAGIAKPQPDGLRGRWCVPARGRGAVTAGGILDSTPRAASASTRSASKAASAVGITRRAHRAALGARRPGPWVNAWVVARSVTTSHARSAATGSSGRWAG
jgi:hypothetical protein